jgi:hypothetical protein
MRLPTRLSRALTACALYACVVLLLSATAKASVVDDIVEALKKAPAPQPPYKIAACAIFRNERPYLQEWILYHFLIGFEHFWLYDNDSTDSPREVLQPFIDRGLVTLFDWPSRDGLISQAAELKDCFNTSNPKPSHWITNHDIDEFPVVLGAVPRLEEVTGREPFVLHEMLDAFRRHKVGAIVVDRMGFGTNGHRTPITGLQMREFTSRLVERGHGYAYRRPSLSGKIFQLMEALRPFSVPTHGTALIHGWNISRADLKPVVHADGAVWEPLRLNHYVTRSYQECMDKLDPVINRQSPTTNWRSKNSNMCNSTMEGVHGYTRARNAPNFELAGSTYPDIIQRLYQGRL